MDGEVKDGGLSEADRLRAGIELVWRMHVQKECHLGMERRSGLLECIPCTCALILGRAIDSGPLTIEEIKSADAMLAARQGKGRAGG